MPQLIQLLVGGLVVFVVAIWSVPSIRAVRAERRQRAIERSQPAPGIEAGQPRTTSSSRDLAGELGKVVDLRSEPTTAVTANGGRTVNGRGLDVEAPVTEHSAIPEVLPSPVGQAPVDIASPFDPGVPVDLDLVEVELAAPTEAALDTRIHDVVDAIVAEDEDGSGLQEELRAILPGRTPGATLPAIDHLEMDEVFLAELLGPAQTSEPPPELGDSSPPVRQSLHDLWGTHGSDHEVLVKALHALSALD
ncbi:MAG: hypothetical protein GY713_09665 [Actinomycetia bacterium]|nr:hypothetical protein [Actinomycetes bacterium]